MFFSLHWRFSEEKFWFWRHMCLLKVVVSRDFWHFLLYPTWAPDKQAKMVLLKESLSWRYSRNKWLHSDYHCAELDSALTNTARSHKNKFAEIYNWLTLRGVEFFELAIEILLENEKVSTSVFVCLQYMSQVDSFKQQKFPKRLVTLSL